MPGATPKKKLKRKSAAKKRAAPKLRKEWRNLPGLDQPVIDLNRPDIKIWDAKGRLKMSKSEYERRRCEQHQQDWPADYRD